MAARSNSQQLLYLQFTVQERLPGGERERPAGEVRRKFPKLSWGQVLKANEGTDERDKGKAPAELLFFLPPALPQEEHSQPLD